MKTKKRMFVIIISVLAIVVALICLFPLIFMILSGFKEKTEVLAVPFKLLPKSFKLENYLSLFANPADLKGQGGSQLFPDGVSFVRSIFFTFGVSAFSVVLSLAVNSMAAYVFAKLRFALKKLMWVYYLIPWFVPGISVYISCFMVANSLGILDTFWVLTIPGIASSFSIFFFRQFYLNIPASLDEAAMLDGASRFRTFLSVYVPLSKTPFIVMGANTFLGYWSAFLWPALTISSPERYMINQLIAFFKSGYQVQEQMIMAASAIAALPTILLFLIFQRYITQGVKIAGLK